MGKVWDVELGQEVATLLGHSAEIISIQFNSFGDRLITGSFDNTVNMWDVETGQKVLSLIGITYIL